jgi:predicted metal-dependent HD superfamily phosphohydrolase
LDYVSDLIRSTARHLPQNKQPDCFYFLDFDLAILAATPSVYQSYAVAVWKEYQTTYPKPIYKMGRKKVLKAFLERDFIYYTSLYQKKFEGIARKNIQFELNT